jgi:hypothetical protein
MKKTNFNIQLRGKILEKALILEELSSHIIKLVLRIVWDETRTLGNKSTSLSFKNKVDLLFDLKDLGKDDYNYLLKIMEVRNQFAHNIQCNLWEDFKEINPKAYKFIENKFPNDDESFSTSFRDMFKYSHSKLIEIEKKYSYGYDFEIEKIITNEVFQRVDEITEKSFDHWINWCENLDISEYDTKLSVEEFKIDAIKKILVLNFLKYREKLYRVYRAIDFNTFRENLRRKVEDKHIQDYVDRLDKKYDFVYNEEWDEATENEVLEDDYLTEGEHGY